MCFLGSSADRPFGLIGLLIYKGYVPLCIYDWPRQEDDMHLTLRLLPITRISQQAPLHVPLLCDRLWNRKVENGSFEVLGNTSNVGVDQGPPMSPAKRPLHVKISFTRYDLLCWFGIF